MVLFFSHKTINNGSIMKNSNASTIKVINGTFCIELPEKIVTHMGLTSAESLEKATLQRKWNVTEQQVSKLIGEIADNKLTMSAMIQRHLKTYEDNLATIERSIDVLDKKTRIPLMHFGKHHIEQFLFACEKVLLGGNVEATKALLLATVKEIKVYEDKVDFIGGNLQILANIESNKAGNPEGVPSLISIWR